MESPEVKISLSIIPPFPPRDVEFCRIERASSKFDLVFVFKNFKKQFYKVKDISLASIDGVKDQLSSLAIKYTEGIHSQSGGSGNGEGSDGGDGTDDGGPPRRKKRKVAEDSTAATISSSGEAWLEQLRGNNW